MSETQKIVCPTCKTQLEVGMTWAARPFCSERCKMADRGKWLDGDFVISRPMTRDEVLADAVRIVNHAAATCRCACEDDMRGVVQIGHGEWRVAERIDDRRNAVLSQRVEASVDDSSSHEVDAKFDERTFDIGLEDHIATCRPPGIGAAILDEDIFVILNVMYQIAKIN